MKYKGILFILFFMMILSSNITFAQIPEYSVNIDLKNKSVELDESMFFIIHLRGGGICEKSQIEIDTEGIMSFEHGLPIIVDRSNLSDIKPVEFEEFTESCIRKGKPVSYKVNKSYEAGSLGIDLGPIRKSTFQDFEMIGTLKPLDGTQSGEYDIEASFYCFSKGQWHIFRDKQSFRVFLKGEREQFVSANILAWIAIIISILALIISKMPRQRS